MSKSKKKKTKAKAVFKQTRGPGMDTNPAKRKKAEPMKKIRTGTKRDKYLEEADRKEPHKYHK